MLQLVQERAAAARGKDVVRFGGGNEGGRLAMATAFRTAQIDVAILARIITAMRAFRWEGSLFWFLSWWTACGETRSARARNPV